MIHLRVLSGGILKNNLKLGNSVKMFYGTLTKSLFDTVYSSLNASLNNTLLSSLNVSIYGNLYRTLRNSLYDPLNGSFDTMIILKEK